MPLVNTVLVEELEQVEVQTADLLGYHVTIKTLEAGKLAGTVIQSKDDMVLIELTKTDHGVKSNVVLMIEAEDGKEYNGTFL